MTIVFTVMPEECPWCDSVLTGLHDVIGLKVARYNCGTRITKAPSQDVWRSDKVCDKSVALPHRARIDLVEAARQANQERGDA